MTTNNAELTVTEATRRLNAGGVGGGAAPPHSLLPSSPPRRPPLPAPLSQRCPW